jgi:hypothetical protein
MMKGDPKRVKQIISANLETWARVYSSETLEAVYISIPNDAEALFTAYQDHFAVNLAT